MSFHQIAVLAKQPESRGITFVLNGTVDDWLLGVYGLETNFG